MKSRKSGFTLVELLVVVLATTALVSVWPRPDHVHGRDARCKNNLRQLGEISSTTPPAASGPHRQTAPRCSSTSR